MGAGYRGATMPPRGAAPPPPHRPFEPAALAICESTVSITSPALGQVVVGRRGAYLLLVVLVRRERGRRVRRRRMVLVLRGRVRRLLVLLLLFGRGRSRVAERREPVGVLVQRTFQLLRDLPRRCRRVLLLHRSAILLLLQETMRAR